MIGFILLIVMMNCLLTLIKFDILLFIIASRYSIAGEHQRVIVKIIDSARIVVGVLDLYLSVLTEFRRAAGDHQLSVP